MAPRVSNVILYIDDAVRYDYSNERLSNLGVTFKTIAGSIHTPPSFATILTGQYVSSHGITGFGTRLSEKVNSIFDLEHENIRIADKGGLNKSIAKMYPGAQMASFEELDEPFIWVVRGPGGHAPYNKFNMESFEFIDENARDYLHRLAGKEAKLREEYEAGVETGIDEFERVVGRIKKKGLEENTIIIYCSDHGELLGEYGCLGHNHIACPELVYVPTTFVHPSLQPKLQKRTIRHVDILPTITEALGLDVSDWMIDGTGISLNNTIEPEKVDTTIGYNQYNQKFYTKKLEVSRKVKSCWDRDGGHALVEASYPDSMLTYMGVLFKSHCGKHIRSTRSYMSPLKYFLPGYYTLGNPKFSQEDFKRFLEQSKLGDETNLIDPDGRNEYELDRENLQDLGYL